MALNLAKPKSRTESDDDSNSGSRQVIRRDTSSSNSNGHGHSPADTITPLSSAEIIGGDDLREFILLAGKDGVGKSCAVVSLAAYVELISPDAQFFCIDTENKLRTALKSFGSDAPQNIVYYKTDNMNQVTWAADQILAQHKRGDWLAVESMSRVWERAQDLGYQAIAGMMKAEYMERRQEQIAEVGKKNAASPVPSPDQLWNIVKGAHDGAFLDRLTSCDTLNVLLTTTMARPPKEGGFMKENQDRRALRIELGIDAGLEGAPRLPYYAECLMILELKGGKVTCRVLRDNMNTSDDSRGEFAVEGKKTWAQDFYGACR